MLLQIEPEPDPLFTPAPVQPPPPLVEAPEAAGWFDSMRQFFIDLALWLGNLPELVWDLAIAGFYTACDYVLDLLFSVADFALNLWPSELIQSGFDGLALARPYFWFANGWLPVAETLALFSAWYGFLAALTAVKWLIKAIPTVG